MKSALIAAVVAAVVAAATSTAATTIVITSKQIKNGTIQSVDISAKTKRALKGNRGARGARGPTGAQGATGAAGPAGAQGPPGIQTLTPVSNSVSVPEGMAGEVTAPCPSGQRPVSGGFGFFGILTGSRRNATAAGWTVAGENDLTIGPLQLTAFAYCSPNISG